MRDYFDIGYFGQHVHKTRFSYSVVECNTQIYEFCIWTYHIRAESTIAQRICIVNFVMVFSNKPQGSMMDMFYCDH